MAIKKFKKFFSEPKEENTPKEENIKISKTTHPDNIITLDKVTNDMIDSSFTELQRLMNSDGYKSGYLSSEKTRLYNDIFTLVKTTFLNRLADGTSKNNKEFLKKALEFLKNS